MSDNMYTLGLSGEGLKIDRQVDQPTALAIVNLVLGGAAQPLAAVSAHRAPSDGKEVGSTTDAGGQEGGGTLSVGEFIDQVSARRNPDKIAAMGAYLKDRGVSEFTPEEIKPMFQEAGESTPANFSRDWRLAIGAKWIAPAGGSNKTFYITNTGLKAVKANFSADVRKQATQSRKPRKKSGTPE